MVSKSDYAPEEVKACKSVLVELIWYLTIASL